MAKTPSPPASEAALAEARQLLNNQLKGSLDMPKGQKAPTDAKSVYVKFTESDDIALYERLSADAKAKRYDLSTYVLLVLLEAYAAPVSAEV